MNKAAHNPIGEGDYISYSAKEKGRRKDPLWKHKLVCLKEN